MVVACLGISTFLALSKGVQGKSRHGSFYFHIDLLEIKLSIVTKSMLKDRVARPRPGHALPFWPDEDAEA
jgi:hypothetical protein